MVLLLAALSWLAGVEAPRAAPDAGFAFEVFEGVPGDWYVLAGRRAHRAVGGWGCTYAIIGFFAAAPPMPATTSGRFGGDWQPGPLPPTGDTQRDALASCEGEWRPEVAARVRHAARSPDALWVRDEVGETLSLWSASDGIAAWVRYGD